MLTKASLDLLNEKLKGLLLGIPKTQTAKDDDDASEACMLPGSIEITSFFPSSSSVLMNNHYVATQAFSFFALKKEAIISFGIFPWGPIVQVKK